MTITSVAFGTIKELEDTAASLPADVRSRCYCEVGPKPVLFYQSTDAAAVTAGSATIGMKSRLLAYASQKQVAIMFGGTMVAVGGGVSVECSTDAASLVLLQGANTLATSAPTTTFNWVQTNGIPISLTSAQINTMFSSVTTFIQSTFTQLSSVINAINTGKITTTAGVDTPPSPIPAWPVNT